DVIADLGNEGKTNKENAKDVEKKEVQSKLLYHQEGVTSTVGLRRGVEETLSGDACWVRQVLLVNSKPDASLGVLFKKPAGGCKELLEGRLGNGFAMSPEGDTETQVLSGLLPICLYAGEKEPRSALVIGWGSGITVGAALQSPLRELTAVELEQKVVDAARYFEPYNNIPQRDPRLTLINADGRNFLAASKSKFDVVISEPSNPWMAGCGNLFTQEFFQQVREHLEPDGIFLQWLQAYEIAPENVWSILGTISGVFESVHVFNSARAKTDLLLIARRSRGKFEWDKVAKRMATSGIREQFQKVEIYGPGDLFVRMIAGTKGVRRISSHAPKNTDDNARIEFEAPKDLVNYRRFSPYEIVSQLKKTLGDPRSELANIPENSGDEFCWAEIRAGRESEAVKREDAGYVCKEAAKFFNDGLSSKVLGSPTISAGKALQ
ncbi:MAG: fused MFS/spermidine synthase, partial [Pseudomonadota bacterium]